MFILNYPAFIRTAAAVSNRIDQLNEWFAKQQGSIDSQLNNIHKNTRDNLSRNRRRLEELQRQQDEVGSKSTRDEKINKLEKMDKNLKLDYKAQLAKQYDKLLDKVENNRMMVERVTPKDAAEAARKEEMLNFFREMSDKLNAGIERIQYNVSLESAFPIIKRQKDYHAENLPDSPSTEEYLDMPYDRSRDRDVEFHHSPDKEWLTSQEQEARGLLDMAESDIESYVTTYNEIKQEAQEKGFLMGYIERSVKTSEESGSSLVDENGVFSGGAALMKGLKITPKLLDSFGTVWYNTVQAIEPDDDNTWPARFIFHAEIPYDSIDWKEMHNQYVQTTEAIPGELYVKKGAPVKIVRIEQISDTEESASYNMPAERNFTVKATFETNYQIRIAGVNKDNNNMDKTIDSRYSNKILSKSTDFEKIAFDLFASLPLKKLKKVASIYAEINKIASSNEDEKLQYLISSFFSALDEVAPEGTKFSMRSDGSFGFWGGATGSITKTSALPLEDEENPFYKEPEGRYHEPQFDDMGDVEYPLPKDSSPVGGEGVTDAINSPSDQITQSDDAELIEQESNPELQNSAIQHLPADKVDISDKLVDTSLSPEELGTIEEMENENEYSSQVTNFINDLKKRQNVQRMKQVKERVSPGTPGKEMGSRSPQEMENKNLIQELSTNRW